MPSSAPARVVFAVLVLATSAAFLVAQRLKRSTPIVDQVHYPHYIAPDCNGCKYPTARFYFKLRHAGRVTVAVVNDSGDTARTLVDDRRLSRQRHSYVWNGRTDDGLMAPDGVYHLRVTLRDEARSVTSPLSIRLDTVPPHPRLVAVTPSGILPGAPGTLGRVRIRYRPRSYSTPVIEIYRTDLPRPDLVTAFTGRRGRQTAKWYGTLRNEQRGTPVPDGVYTVVVKTYDRAGNQGSTSRVLPPTATQAKPGTGVSVRYLTVSGSLDPVQAGSEARFRIGPTPRRLRWSLGPVGPGRTLARGGGSGRQLAVTVPPDTASGVYLLRVQAAGHRAVQPVVVQGAKRGSVLVVVPAITWQGVNQVDDDNDGFPNTLGAGEDVGIARPFAHGLAPAGLKDSVDPLLRFLAREKAPYDITTDLALAQGRDPGFIGHKGVLFVGDETWLTSQVDVALRGYVQNGGRVASFGTDAFRRQVGLAGNQLVNPSRPERFNVFGEQVNEARIEQAPMAINQPDTLGLFRDVANGVFGDFNFFEQSQRLVGGAQILSSAGRDPQHPAFIAYRLGKGIVVRSGSREWGPDLAGSVELTDVTRRVWSLLSR